MLTWLSLVNFWTKEEQQHQQRQRQQLQKHVIPGQDYRHCEKPKIRTKADPITRTTSVNVAAEDNHSGHQSDFESKVPDEKLSATLALSLELAKQNSLPQQRSLLHTEATLSKSSSRESLVWLTSNRQQSKALSIKSGRSTTVHRWVYPSKAMAEALSTSVSASGSILTSDLSDDDDLVSDRGPHTIENFTLHKNDSVSSMGRSAAISKLLKQVETSSSSADMVTKSEDLFHHNITASSLYTQSDMMTHINTQTATVQLPSEVAERSLSPTSSGGNPVLPAFHTVFQATTHLEFPNRHNAQNTPQSFLETAKNIFTNAFRQAEEYPQELKKQMFAKFAKFIPNMKDRVVEQKIVIVSVHGWFPTKLVRSMIGEPTGTSKKFCKQMASALRQYFALEHQLVLPDNVVTSIPLEGEGKVEERVEKLYQQLLSNLEWLEAISSADVILWGTHSQGTPVSVMLLHRLLERGHIHLHRQPICMLAMAGIGHGPFPVLKGSLIVKYVEADAARELFEFMDSNSDVSRKFRQSLNYILHQGVKMVLVGSLQDQVVPLYSALLSAISHPNILRAVYIDKHLYSENNFLISLVIFALRLRNAGLSDHGLFTNISEVLAGSLYALEGGHSTIYEEIDVYMTAIRYLFDTPPFGQRARSLWHGSHSTNEFGEILHHDAHMETFQAKLRPNPFYLPWILRGIFDDPAIKENMELFKELKHLRDLFLQWEPTDARLKEIKFRLEPLKDLIISSPSSSP